MFKKHIKKSLTNLPLVSVNIETKGLFLDMQDSTSKFLITELFKYSSCNMFSGLDRLNTLATTQSSLLFSEVDDW